MRNQQTPSFPIFHPAYPNPFETVGLLTEVQAKVMRDRPARGFTVVLPSATNRAAGLVPISRCFRTPLRNIEPGNVTAQSVTVGPPSANHRAFAGHLH